MLKVRKLLMIRMLSKITERPVHVSVFANISMLSVENNSILIVQFIKKIEIIVRMMIRYIFRISCCSLKRKVNIPILHVSKFMGTLESKVG